MSNNNQGIKQKKSLFTFDSVLYTDYGFAWVIYKYFYNSDFINKSIFNCNNDRVLFKIATRIDDNPLTVLINNPEKYDLNNLYNEIYNKYEEEILYHSIPSNIINMISSSTILPFIPTIVCKNNIQKNIINSLFESTKLDIVISDTLDTINISEYDGIFIHKVSDLSSDVINKAQDSLVRINIPMLLYNFMSFIDENGEIDRVLKSIIMDNIKDYRIINIYRYIVPTDNFYKDTGIYNPNYSIDSININIDEYDEVSEDEFEDFINNFKEDI